MPYADPKALVLHEPIDPTIEGIVEVVDWLRKEVIGGAAVAAALAAEADLAVVDGTFPLSKPNFWLSSFTGAAPALLSGEAGRFTQWLDERIIGYANLFEKDALCEVDIWKDDLSRFPKMRVNIIPGSVHAHLLSRKSRAKARGRLHRLDNQNRIHGTNYEDFDATYIHGSYLGMPADDAA